MRQLLFAVTVTAANFALTAATPIPLKNDKTVLVLGGGVAGIIAARSLAEKNIDNFLVVEARNELGGRMRSQEFGAEGKRAIIELGANWVQGTHSDVLLSSRTPGPANPILTLASKHGIHTTESDFYDSVATYDESGEADYLDVFDLAVAAHTNLTVQGVERFSTGQVDMTARAGYSLLGMQPKTPPEMASEYYMDWQYAQTPEQTSWVASSLVHRFTFDVEYGGFSPHNLISVDQRGFKHLIQAEAATFLRPEQLLLNATVRSIAHSRYGVIVTLANGTSISADYVISTFSLGVLQNDDVLFDPALPMWKQEAIHSMTMATYTKIFLQFEQKFWFDTQFALYADRERGRYPVWQSLDLEGFLPGSGIIFATVTGDYAKRIESLSDAQVEAELLEVLEIMFNTTIPAPTAFFFPRWSADPLYRGSYSNWPASFVSSHHTNLRANVGQRLWFAGEATSQKYFGYLHGAYFEGMHIGERVAECVVAGGQCNSLPFFESVQNSGPHVHNDTGAHLTAAVPALQPFLAGVVSSLPFSWLWLWMKAALVHDG